MAYQNDYKKGSGAHNSEKNRATGHDGRNGRPPIQRNRPAYGSKPAFDRKPADSNYRERAEREPFREAYEDESASDVEGGLLFGRNAVMELLRSGRQVDKLLIQKGEREGSITVIEALAKQNGIPIVDAERAKLDAIAGHVPHQGVIAYAAAKEYCDVEDMLRLAEEKGEPPFLVIADGINDPYNLGALIRCAEGAGAHGLIIPKRRSVGLTPIVSKSSAGAMEHLLIAKVPNLATTIEKLKERGVWIYAAETGGQECYDTDLTGACAIVLGSEGNGISELVLNRSDFRISIPMAGKVNSFNVSAAGAVILCETAHQRRRKQRD